MIAAGGATTAVERLRFQDIETTQIQNDPLNVNGPTSSKR
jgi:hypothetical protein